MKERSPKFFEAAQIIVNNQQASTSFLQRKLGLGFSQATLLIEELEDAGVVGLNKGANSREVLISSEEDLQRILG